MRWPPPPRTTPNKAAPPTAKPARRRPPPPRPKEPQNLIANPGFEDVTASPRRLASDDPRRPGQAHRRLRRPLRRAQRPHHLRPPARDASWSQDVKLKPNTRYRLSAWVKTKGVAGDAMGALFNLHQLQQDGLPKPLKGDNDWTQLTSEFASGVANTADQLNMLFGGWGRSKGEAWCDDVQLIELGPGGPARCRPRSGRRRQRPGQAREVIKIVTRHYADPPRPIRSSPRSRPSRAPIAALAESVLDGLVAGWPDGKPTPPPSSATPTRPPARRDRQGAPARPARPPAGARRPLGPDGDLRRADGRGAQDGEDDAGQRRRASADRVDAAKRLIRLSDDAKTIGAILDQVTPAGLERALALPDPGAGRKAASTTPPARSSPSGTTSPPPPARPPSA